MAEWHHLKHKATGEEQTVASLDGVDLANWKAEKLPREPKVDEHVVAGKIAKREGRDKEARERSTIVHLTLADLRTIINEQLVAAGLIPSA